MDKDKALVVFQDKKIRRIWYNNEWFYSVVDIVEVLTDSDNPRNYWSMLKKREEDAGIELSTNCVQLKLVAPDGKLRETDCANTKSIFRIIQSIPSKKAEPFKLWLAQVGYERIEEIENPEIGQDRIKEYYGLNCPLSSLNAATLFDCMCKVSRFQYYISFFTDKYLLFMCLLERL
jgi:hypothetical protein